MPRTALTGTRIRERRTLLGWKQADLAARVGISPAYLNLIEHNRRRVGAGLLVRLAEAIGAEVGALEEGSEAPVFEGLREAASGVADPSRPPETDRIEEFVGRFPGWAALLAERQTRARALERTVADLTGRMAHDPHLAATLHEVLSLVTSLRSTAAILAETDDIAAEWRARFHGNLAEDSERLTEVSTALAAYLDGRQESEAALSSPQEEFEAWLAARGYHVAELERDDPPPPESLTEGAADLASAASRRLAEAWLLQAQADARAVPLVRLAAALVAQDGSDSDPWSLARVLGVPVGTVFRRLAALPAGQGLPDAGLVVCDAAGTLRFRRPIAGFPLPRFGGACPIWPLFEALARPGAPIRAVVTTAGLVQRRFVTYAISSLDYPEGLSGPALSEAMMLILPAPFRTAQEPARRVGPACRICGRGDCAARREPSITAR
jgi:hypothetical protein